MAEEMDREEGYDALFWPRSIERGLEAYYGEAVPLAALAVFTERWRDHAQEQVPRLVLEQWQAYEITRQSGFALFYDDDYAKAANGAWSEQYVPISAVKAFINQFQGLGQIDTYLRALSHGGGADREVALCVLGESDLPQVKELLGPFLQSSSPKERWLSAFALGRRREATALPMLCRILTEFLPAERLTPVQDQPWFEEKRFTASNILSSWEDPSLIVIFRQALARLLQAEPYLPVYTDKAMQKNWMYRWYSYQDSLLTALGKWGAFGALVGLALSPRRRRVAIIDMVASYCHVEKYYTGPWERYPWMKHHELRVEMMKTMEHAFGLSAEERERLLDEYAQDVRNRNNLVDEAM